MTLRPLGRNHARRLAAAGLVGVLGLSLAACSSNGSDPSDAAAGRQGDATGTTDGDGPTGSGVVDGDGEAAASGPTIKANVAKGAASVPVSTVVQVSADAGSLTDVTVTSAEGEVPGEMGADGLGWRATDRLEPGTTYTVTALAEDGGETSQLRRKFTTVDLTLDEQTYPSVAPLDGETVGVGMPIVVRFDIAVTDKAEFERNMTVTSQPAQQGSWYWLSGNEAHWRPKTYWKAGSKVHVDIGINGVEAGGGIYGQENREIDFKIGDAHVYKVDAKTYQMKVFENGKLIRTLPITTGEQPDFTTRSGVKVIMEKFESKRMNSETVGITGADAYDIDNVQWAMRVTNSGEFIHAAPWSVGSQGRANVSHGCTGMSTADAAWLYAMSRRGDVVEYTGTDRPMTFDNGYGDWNKSFAQYTAGSAL